MLFLFSLQSSFKFFCYVTRARSHLTQSPLGMRPTSIPSDILMHAAVLQPFDHNRNGPNIGEGALPPFLGRVERGPHLTQSRLGWDIPPYQVASWSIQPFGCNRYGPKIGGSAPLWGRGAGSPSKTMWPGPRPTCMPSFILIHPTVWPQ